MQYKKEVLEFLEKSLEETTKLAVLNEAERRSLESLFIAFPKDNEIAAKSTSVSKTKKILESKLRNLRAVIQEVKEGKLEV